MSSRHEKAPTIQDVAREAGVSRQTVSNVLNRPEIVRPETKEKVDAAIARLGYRRHAAARRLRTRRSSTIGIHLDPYSGGISGAVLDRFVHALTEHASERGMRMIVYAARSAEEEIERLGELVEGGEVDAVVISGTFHGDPRTRWLRERAVPFVSFGRPWGEDDVGDPAHLWVDVDGAAGTREATRHALQHGRRVAFLGWPTGSGTGDDRASGWREVIGAEGDPTSPRVEVIEDVNAARAAIEPHIRDLDAVVCVSDTLAFGAYLAALAAGRRELPIYGFDNTPVAEALGFSSVEQQPEEVARGVLELLMGPSGSEVTPRRPSPGTAHVLVTPKLIVRAR
ncbi:MAG: LacI family DNA-binding transcriptional regulator [Actinomycetes bacterium]